MNKLIIIGDGETAQLAYEYFTYDSNFVVTAFAVEEKYLSVVSLNEVPVVAFEQLLQTYDPQEYYAFIAISSTKLNRLRTRLYQATKELGYEFASYVSSKAFIWRDVEIGENCFILEDNTIQPFVKIGNNVTLWSGNHIGHRSVVRDNCFITSHVVISGYCDIGKNCFIGVNSAVSNNIKIGEDCLVSLGSVISKDTECNGIYKGNPAIRHHLSAKRFFNITD
ncbi:MAG: acetyltransferase [Syntrophomonas sp.]